MNAQQWFAFTPQANFPAHSLSFHWMWSNLGYLLKSFRLYKNRKKYGTPGNSVFFLRFCLRVLDAGLLSTLSAIIHTRHDFFYMSNSLPCIYECMYMLCIYCTYIYLHVYYICYTFIEVFYFIKLCHCYLPIHAMISAVCTESLRSDH